MSSRSGTQAPQSTPQSTQQSSPARGNTPTNSNSAVGTRTDSVNHPSPLHSSNSRVFNDTKCTIARTTDDTITVKFPDDDVVKLKPEQCRQVQRVLSDSWERNTPVWVRFVLAEKAEKTNIFVVKRADP